MRQSLLKFRSLVHTYVNRRRYLKVQACPGWGALREDPIPTTSPCHALLLSRVAVAPLRPVSWLVPWGIEKGGKRYCME